MLKTNAESVWAQVSYHVICAVGQACGGCLAESVLTLPMSL